MAVIDALKTAAADLSRDQYMDLQKELEHLELAAAQGQDMPDHAERIAALDAAMEASPWALHPDFGCVRKEVVRGSMPAAELAEAERYETLAQLATRPPVYSFVSDEPEFYRWYEYGGRPRDEPLTSDELSDYLQKERGYTESRALEASEKALSAEDWAWFKDEFFARKGLPFGWSESGPGGMATNLGQDGGIVDVNPVMKKWFVIFNRSDLEPTDPQFDTRLQAFEHYMATMRQYKGLEFEPSLGAQEIERVATMAEAQAEHRLNSGGRLLFDDGMFDEDREAWAAARRDSREREKNPPAIDDGSNDLPF